MASPYRVVLDETRRAHLRTPVGSGIASARLLTWARVLLRAHHGHGSPGWADAASPGALDLHPATVQRIRRQFVTEGLTATLQRKRPDRVSERAFDGR